MDHNQDQSLIQRGDFLKCLSEFFKRDLVSIPIVKKYVHQTICQRSGLRAATIELDTAAHPDIEYIAGTRLSIYPLNPAGHVQCIMEHLIDDVSPGNNNNNHSHHYSHQVLINNFAKFAQLTGRDCLRLALTYLFDIMTAPSRGLIHLLAENCSNKEQKRRLIAIGQSDESWERWLCSSHRTLKSLLDELSSCKLSAGKLLNELSIQQPRQYSISNIKSSRRSRTEIIVLEHKYSLRQIELNLRQLRDRETYELVSPPSAGPNSPRVGPIREQGSPNDEQQAARNQRSPSRPPARQPTRNSKGSQRSIRSMVSYASSPITTHQVPRMSTFSGPLVSAYASATSSQSSSDTRGAALSSVGQDLSGGREHSRGSRVSLLSVLQNHDKLLKRHHSDLAPASPGPVSATSTTGPGQSHTKFEGLCSNYLLNLNSSDQILCEFIENPRFTLKGNRERPIMMIGQDVGMIAFKAFLQQRHLEHDRAQVFYSMFKDLEPKKFGEMQLVCLTGHRARVEELFKQEVQNALSDKILSSVSYINRRHLVALLTSATTKSQLVLAQLEKMNQQQQQQPQQQPQPQPQPAAQHETRQQHSPGVQPVSSTQTIAPATGSSKSSSTSKRKQPGEHKFELSITSKELLELGDKIHKLLVENKGCLYTCCDPHMTQAIEILTFESIARNNRSITREQLMELLPKWKGGGKLANEELRPGYFQLENTYERARIVQEIYDSSI